MTQLVTSSLVVFEAVIRVKIKESDKIMLENQKKRENMEIKDILDKSPSKRSFIHDRIHSLQWRSDARGSTDVIYAWFPALPFRSSVSVFITVSVKPCP